MRDPVLRRRLVWATLFSAGVLYEAMQVHGKTGNTLSEVTRAVTRVDTPEGRMAFLVGWGGFAAWFAHHIVTVPPPPDPPLLP